MSRLGCRASIYPTPRIWKKFSAVDPTTKFDRRFFHEQWGKEVYRQTSFYVGDKNVSTWHKKFHHRGILHQKNHPDTYLIDDYFAKNLAH